MRISDWSSDVCSSDLSNRVHSLWHHAVDLISAGKWRELLEKQEFTEPRNIFNDVVYGLRYSDHADRKASVHISTVEARQIMGEMRANEPTKRAASLRSFSAQIGTTTVLTPVPHAPLVCRTRV